MSSLNSDREIKTKMKTNRTTILMAILLVMVGVLFLKTTLEATSSTARTTPLTAKSALPATEETQLPKEEILPGKNEIKNIEITRGDDGNLYAIIDYYFTGNIALPYIRVLADSPANPLNLSSAENEFTSIKKGHNTIKAEIIRPYEPTEEFTSKKIIVYILSRHDRADAAKTKKEINYNIAWITQLKYESDRNLANKTNDELYTESVELIDHAKNNITLGNAKLNLERILLKDPSYITAYPELARVAMKTNWGPEGLKQAETYLNMGLTYKPDHANSHVLLGYVYAHQERFDIAHQEFENAAKIGTENLWLWANWGELHKMQGDSEKAIEMYQKAVAGARPFNTYDRARLDAYRNLLTLLSGKEQALQAEKLYAKRADEFSNMPCLRSEYAAFKIYTHQDYDGALSESRKAMTNGCNTDQSRQIMALANYVGWMKAKEDQRAAYFAQAQLLFPTSPNLIYILASHDNTADVLDELKKTTITLDIRDNKNLNALSYALMSNNINTARRLINLGANLTEPVGEENYPAAIIPFIYEHPEGVQLILEQGLNLSAIRFRGESLMDYAEKSQNPAIIKLVKNKIKT